MFETLVMFHWPMGWSKLLAPLNMLAMAVTFDTSQLLMSWAKLDAPKNICTIVVAFDTSQLPMGWLNEAAL